VSDVFDDNLTLLLRRAYVPARPRPEFRARLREAVVARVSGQQSASAWFTPLRAAAIIMTALVTGFLLWRAAQPGEAPAAPDAPTLEGLIASSEIAVREAPDGEWRAATRAEHGNGIFLNSEYLEVITPNEWGANIRLRDNSGLSLIPASGVIVRGFDHSSVEHTAGQVAVQLERGSTPLQVSTSEGDLLVKEDRLRLMYLRPYDIIQRGGVIGSFDVQEPIVRLYVPEGRSSYVGPPELDLALDRTYYLQEGALLEEGNGLIPGELRTPLVPDQVVTPPVPPTGGRLEGRVLDAETGDPVTSFRVWLRREVPLPSVSDPERHLFPSADGTFLIEGVEPGNYTILIEAEGHAAWKERGQVLVLGATAALDVRLAQGASTRGIVVDAETGAPVAGALVLAERDIAHQVIHAQGFELAPLPLAHAFTDELGAYELTHMRAGTHNLRVSHADYAPAWSSAFELLPGAEHELAPLELAEGGRVFGRVEGEDGNPRAGAEVVASFMSFSGSALMTYGAAVTAADGSYAIEDLPPGYFVVLLISPGGVVRQTSVKAGGETRVDFLGPVRRTRIHGVLRGRGGQPMTGAVNLAPGKQLDGYTDWVAAATRADGTFEFNDIEPGPYSVYWSESMGEDQLFLQTADVAGSEYELDLRLPNTELRGNITSAETGEPVPRAGVLAIRSEDGESYYAGRLKANADGEYDLSGLPPGNYEISAADLEGPHAQHLGDYIELVLGEPLIHDFALELGGHVTVHVVDAAGEPVAGVGVHVFDDQGRHGVCFFPVTDGEGNCSYATLAPGTWTASCRGQEVGVEILRGQPASVTIRLP